MSESRLYPPLEVQVPQVMTALELEIHKPWIALRGSRVGDRRREATRRSPVAIAARWLLRMLERSNWRYVAVGAPYVEWSDDQADAFIRGIRIFKASLRVVFPPAAPFEDETEIQGSESAGVVVVPLAMPRPLSITERNRRASRRRIDRNRAEVAKLEREAVRITQGPAGRCFEMAGGQLLVVRNEQPPGYGFEHSQWILPITKADAEDFYGWSPE